MALWSKLIPELLSTNGKAVGIGNEDDDDGDVSTNGGGGFRSILPLSTIALTKSRASPTADSSPSEPESSHTPPVMGAQPEVDQSGGGFQVFPFNPTKGSGNTSKSDGSVAGHSGGIALSIVIVIGICFLVLNVCACAGVFYQRDRVRFKEILLQRQYKVRPADYDKDHPASTAQAGAAGQASLVSQRADEDDIEGSANCMQSGLPHQASTSTMDPHTKVSQWMAQEITVERCPTPPSIDQQRNRLTKPALAKLGGSDRYDPRLCETEDLATVMFPQLTKSSKASDIHGLVPVKEEAVDHQKQPGRNVSAPEFHHKVIVEKESKATGPDGPANSVSSAGNTTTSRTGRRKPRSKSQLSLQRSITKRDVAVGGDDDDGDCNYRVTLGEEDPTPNSFGEDERRLSTSAYATMDTIRRLNLPKVLPDLPHQDVPTGALVVSTKRANANPSSGSTPIYATPSDARVDSDERLASTNRRWRQSLVEPPDSEAKQQLHPARRQYSDVSTAEAGGDSAGSPSSAVVKTNLPHQTLVLAPHPRAAGGGTTTTTSRTTSTGPHYNATAPLAEPEPCFVVRPGPRHHHRPAGTAAGGSDYDETDSSTAGPADVVLRRPKQQQSVGVGGTTRPANRNSRSWYAQYSQSFISQSVDQESDANET